MSITVFTKPGCVQCNATYRQLDKVNLDYAKIDVTETLAAYDFLSARDYSQMPVVMVTEESIDVDALDSVVVLDDWTGFNPDKIKELALAQATVAA